MSTYEPSSVGIANNSRGTQEMTLEFVLEDLHVLLQRVWIAPEST